MGVIENFDKWLNPDALQWDPGPASRVTSPVEYRADTLSPVHQYASMYTPRSYAPGQTYYAPVQRSYTPVQTDGMRSVFQGRPADEEILANFPPGSVVLPDTIGSAQTMHTIGSAQTMQTIGPVQWTTPVVQPSVVQRRIVPQPIVQRPVVLQAPPPRVEHITVIHAPNGEVIGEERGEGWGNWGGLNVEPMGVYGGGGPHMGPWAANGVVDAAPAPFHARGRYGAYAHGMDPAPAPFQAHSGYGAYAHNFESSAVYGQGRYQTLAERFPLQTGGKRGRWTQGWHAPAEPLSNPPAEWDGLRTP